MNGINSMTADNTLDLIVYFALLSLTSILWALLVTAIGLYYDVNFGFHIAHALRSFTSH